MKNRLVMTMPIAPYDSFSIGKLSTPILAKSLSHKLCANYLLAVNCLDSYKNREIETYQRLLKKYDLEPNAYWIDQNHIEQLLEKIDQLSENVYIRQKEKEILCCPCHKVEISTDNLASINLKDACFTIQDGKYYCTSCKEECRKEKQKVLVFQNREIPHLECYPNYINKDIKTFHHTVATHDIIISRLRDTGVKYSYLGENYNLDIDFLWQVYLSLFPNDEKIVMCSNHQLYQLYMVGMLEECFKNHERTILLATPYLKLTKEDKEKSEELKNRKLSLLLFSLFNTKWNQKDNVFDENCMKYLNSMSVEKKQMLYDLVMEEIETEDLGEDLNKVLRKDFNRQYASRKLKEKRNG